MGGYEAEFSADSAVCLSLQIQPMQGRFRNPPLWAVIPHRLVTRTYRLNVSNPAKVLLSLTPSHKSSTNFRTPSNYGQRFAVIDVLSVPMHFSLAGQEIQSVSLFPIFK